MKICLPLALIILFMMISMEAQNIPVSNSSATPADERITAYFKAFNTGDEKVMTDYFNKNVAAEALKQRPIEQRLQFYRQMRDDMQTVAVRRISRTNDNEINAAVQAKNGNWFSFTFMLEPLPPNKLVAMRIQPMDAPGGAGTSNDQPALTEAEFLTQTGSYLDELVKNDDFSGVVLIAKGDKVVFTKACGLANKDTKTPNQIDTKFNLGSINKSFTQVAIDQLINQGKISYDDKLGKFLPDYPNKEATEKVTIRQLLAMTSGIGDFFGEKFMAAPKNKIRNISDFIPFFAAQPLAFEPGTRNKYSNGGYILLGAIIEKVTGQSYYDYVRENIYAPLGMNNTAFYESDKITPNMAEGYTRRGDKPDSSSNTWANNLNTRPARGSSAGGGYSTAADLLKYSLALQTGKIQLPDETPAMKDAGGKFMGMGIAGGSPGVNAALEIMPESGYTIIVLSNYDPPSAEKAARQLRGFLGRVKK